MDAVEEGRENYSSAFGMREYDVWIIDVDRRSYELDSGKYGGSGATVPKLIERW